MFLSDSLTVKEFQKDIELNLTKSHGSYIFDDITGHKFLDFFSFFSSNTLGYNHSTFKTEEFREDILKYSEIKVSSGRVYLKYFDEFIQEWHQFVNCDVFSKYYFIHGGALAIEASLKVAFDYKREKYDIPAQNLKVISFQGSFHGVSGYTLSLSDLPPSKINDFPKFDWKKVSSPTVGRKGLDQIEIEEKKCLAELEEYVNCAGAQNIAALIVEPIQCSSGDHVFRIEFFKELSSFCTKYDIVLIFDEIQTGFGVTGKLWYWQHIQVKPDILVFGKKAQVCGIAITPKFEEVFTKPHRLSVTWDGHIIDIIRSRHLLKAMHANNIIKKVEDKGIEILSVFDDFREFLEVRSVGLLIAFDFGNQEKRDAFFQAAYQEKLVVNIAKNNTIRLRPNLSVSTEEIADFRNKMKKILQKIELI